jgi:hypothetical protein
VVDFRPFNSAFDDMVVDPVERTIDSRTRIPVEEVGNENNEPL